MAFDAEAYFDSLDMFGIRLGLDATLELAEIAGVGVNTLIKLERGEGNPTLSVIRKVLDVLGLDICTTIKKNES